MRKVLFALMFLAAFVGVVELLIADDLGKSRWYGVVLLAPTSVWILYRVIVGTRAEKPIHITE